MGKYPSSKIHEAFSKWHWEKCKREAYLTDIDRLWVETRQGQVKAVFDLKYYGSDSMTKAEYIVAEFFEKHGVPYYLVYIDSTLSSWTIYRHKTRKKQVFTEDQMIDWINNDLPIGGDVFLHDKQAIESDKVTLAEFV